MGETDLKAKEQFKADLEVERANIEEDDFEDGDWLDIEDEDEYYNEWDNEEDED